MSRTVENAGLRFACETTMEAWRAETLLTKEPGTVAWLRAQVNRETVFFDVGANVGCYALLAAHWGARRVVAFEPHLFNAAALLRNVAINKLEQIVEVVTAPLHRRGEWGEFAYSSLKAGSSGSQYGHRTSETGAEFQPAAVEHKYSATIDGFLHYSGPPPTLLKLDVDGNELDILKGAVKLLLRTPPASIQVEVRASSRAQVTDYLQRHGYGEPHRHDTAQGAKALAAGMPAEQVPHNLVFSR